MERQYLQAATQSAGRMPALPEKMLFVVAYGISSDGLREKVAHELKNWGSRVQYSVWECDLEPDEAARMTKVIKGLIASGGRLRVYRLCELCQQHSVAVGSPEFASDPDYYQV